MPCYAFGIDKEHLNFVIADKYEIKNDFVNFKTTEKDFLSIAKDLAKVVAVVDDHGELPYTPQHP